VEEREVTVLLVLEDTPALQFGSGAVSKREAQLELAGLVMLLAAVNRDRVGFVHAAPGAVLVREPVRGRGAILHAAAGLLSRPAPPVDAPPGGDPPVPWRFLARAAPRHSILIWLGDFPPRPAPDGWPLLQRRYQTMGFRVDDPWERAWPERTRIAAYDPTAGRVATLEGSPAERSAQTAWRARREAAWQALFPAPLSRLVVGTEENRVDALVRFFHARLRPAAAR
jgi:uncharacterized protein (DUF58 family)